MKRKVTKKAVGFILPCMLVAIFLVATLGGSPSYAQEKTFTYPHIYPLSGPGAMYGISQRRAVDYAAADINAEGGIVVSGVHYKVVPEYLDSAFDVAKAVELVQKVVAQGNKFISVCGQAINMATHDIPRKNNVFVMATALPSPVFINRDHPLFFMDNMGTTDTGPTTYYPYFIKDFKVKNVALCNPDNDSGRNYSNVVKDVIKTWNIPVTLVIDEFYTPNTQDFSPVILRIMAKRPDLIDLAGATPGDCALFLKQVREKGYKGLTSTTVAMVDPVVAWRVAGAYSTGHFALGFMGGDPTPAYTAFKKRYEDQYKEPLFNAVPYVYEHALYLFKAITKANSFDPFKVAAVYQDMTWNGLYGPTKWRGDEPGSPWGIKRIFAVQQPMCRFTTEGKAETWRSEPYPAK